jgi:hypothetical protein
MALDILEEELSYVTCINCFVARYKVRLLTQTIDNDKEYIIAVLVSKKRLVIYCQVLPRALWYRKQV